MDSTCSQVFEPIGPFVNAGLGAEISVKGIDATGEAGAVVAVCQWHNAGAWGRPHGSGAAAAAEGSVVVEARQVSHGVESGKARR